MLDNKKTMLIFGFNEDEISTLQGVVEEFGLPGYKLITQEMVAMSIKDILEGFKFQLHSGDLPEERVILFNNFTDEELDKAIKAVRSNFQSNPILAVVTPTSLEWSFYELLEHLIEEREWYKAQKRGTKSE